MVIYVSQLAALKLLAIIFTKKDTLGLHKVQDLEYLTPDRQDNPVNQFFQYCYHEEYEKCKGRQSFRAFLLTVYLSIHYDKKW